MTRITPTPTVSVSSSVKLSLHFLVRATLYFVLLLFLIFNDCCQTNYVNVYRTDRRKIFRVGRTVALDDQWQPIFVGFIQVPVTFGR